MVTVSGVLVVALYLIAGHQTWWRFLYSDPDADGCPEFAEVVNANATWRAYLFIVVCWLPILLVDAAIDLLEPQDQPTT